MSRVCSFRRKEHLCVNRVKQSCEKVCSYHQTNVQLATHVFYSLKRKRFCSSPIETPEEGDLKCYRAEQVYRFDGCQWRKQCRYCFKAARLGEFCFRHVTPYPTELPATSVKVSGVSKLGCAFLDRLQEDMAVSIQHCHLSDKEPQHEHRIGRYKVDGYISERKTVVEILGDFYHGNPRKFHSNEVNVKLHKTFGELYEQTMARLEDIKSQGYQVMYVWESDIMESNCLLSTSILRPSSLLCSK